MDWAAGIAVNALGHSDPEWADAVARQARKIAHVSNLWEPLELAKMMVESSKHLHKVFFCNSGTEANEAALKFARKVALVGAQRQKAGKLQRRSRGAPRPPAHHRLRFRRPSSRLAARPPCRRRASPRAACAAAGRR